jgi:Predicted CDP-diglyceride synthetase/phosphatidate cytidylyltransferase
MTLNILLYTFGLFVVLYTLGTVLCLKLYHWNIKRFFASTLWTKIYYWIPIFACFLLVLYLQLWAAAAVLVFIVGCSLRELFRITPKRWFAFAYTLFICIASAHVLLYFPTFSSGQAAITLLIVGFSSVMSDVCAYFLGSFSGRFKLPQWINNSKSWDGVFGQIAGAILGFYLITLPISPAPPFSLALIIGVSSAIGDLTNSIVKRRLGIKDWGNTIPGHGGVLDRFASLSLAIAATYWWVVITT